MSPQLPFFIFCLLIHGAVFFSSQQNDRHLRLMGGLAVAFNTWPAWYGGMLLEVNENSGLQLLGSVLHQAPYYLPLLSFLVYWRSSKD